ncbi:MAG: flippase-like domain-containing protein [Deltaproteobacteria bacterium]|nr:flippase-like domain-containing protein [Nannocystaceae bacterium]
MSDGNAPAPTRPRWFDWRILPIAAVTAAFIWVLIRNLAGTDVVLEALQHARWELGLVAVALLLLCQLIAAHRWMLIVDVLGYHLPLGRAIDAMLATWPMALLAPARASDLLRGLAIADICPPMVGAGSVLAEKAIDVQSLCVLAIVGSLVWGVPVVALLALGLLACEWVFVWFLVYRRDRIAALPLLRRKPEKVEQLLVAFSALLARPGRLVVVALTSLASWICATALLQCLIWMMHAEVEVVATLSLWPGAVFAGMMPVTLAGMGTRDLAFIYLLRAAGDNSFQEGALLAATLGYSLVGTWLLAIVGIPFAVRFVLRLRRPASPKLDPPSPRAAEHEGRS